MRKRDPKPTLLQKDIDQIKKFWNKWNIHPRVPLPLFHNFTDCVIKTKVQSITVIYMVENQKTMKVPM